MEPPHTIAPDGLLEKVLHRIQVERSKKQQRIYNMLATSGLLLSGMSLAVMSYKAWADLAQSSTWLYVSLFFSDTRLAFANASDISLSILESIPLLSIVGVLGVALCALLCVKAMTIAQSKTGLSLSINRHNTYAR